MEKASLQEILTDHNRRFSAMPLGNALYDGWPDFAKSLRRIGRAFFQDAAYVPSLLGTEHGIDPLHTGNAISSFHDFWQTLPECFDGQLAFNENELLPLFCALADPPRFGTAPGRYPAQIDLIRNFLKEHSIMSPSLLDVGCGTGLGTLELAKELNAVRAIGITPEPLEIKMANERCLPHDTFRTGLYKNFDNISAEFRIGSILDFQTDETFHVITCNGLIGGPIMHSANDMLTFIANCHRHLKPGGRIFCANNFHDGHCPNVKRLLALADGCHDDWHNAWLQ